MSQLGIEHLRSAVAQLATKLKKPDFLTYFKKLSFLGQEEGNVRVGVVSDFVKDNLEFKFRQVIDETFLSCFPESKTVELVVDEEIDTPSNARSVDCQAALRDINSKKKSETPGVTVEGGMTSRTIQDKYTLGGFIVGPSNELAYAACQAIARKPGGTSYNPLFLYGGVGLGKTHLLQATGNAIKARFKDKKVIYTTADRFLTDYVVAVRNRTTDKLRDKYRNIDTLIIDDVQFLANKEQTQMELYNIFNLMHESGRQIIISSDRAPKELTQLEPRLRSRFEWGIMIDVGAPDFETRLAILQTKAREREFILPQEVAEFIANNVGENVRELEGVLNQIVAEFEMRGTPPTLEKVASRLNKLSFIHDAIGKKEGSTPKVKSYEDLVKAVAEHFGIETKNMLGDGRTKELMIPRQVAMYLLKNKLNYTFERIGNIFSGRNHSAVLYSCKKLETIIKKDQRLFYEVGVIRDKLGL